jgi:hypothetical protein
MMEDVSRLSFGLNLWMMRYGLMDAFFNDWNGNMMDGGWMVMGMITAITIATVVLAQCF